MINFSTKNFSLKQIVFALLVALPFIGTAQKIMYQDFSSSTTVSAYVGSGSGQFDTIGVSAPSTPPSTSNQVYNSSGRMTIQRYSGTGALSKLNLSATNIPFLKVKFKLNIPFNGTATGTAANIYVGSGLSNRTSATGDPASSAGRHSQFGIGFGSSGTFYLRKLNNFTNGDSLTGEQQINWFINNSGAQVTYLNPAGTMSTIENDSAQLWVGNNLYFANISATNPAVDVRDFKIVFNNVTGLGGAVQVDDIDISMGTVALPISFKSFNANLSGNYNQLSWATATEINLKGFYVQRQLFSGSGWENLGFINANNRESNYTFSDINPLVKSVYRLLVIDIEGKESYSKSVLINKKLTNQILVSPNPTTNKILVNLNHIDLDGQSVKVVLTDLNGKQLKAFHSIIGSFEMNVTDLPKGIYLLNIQTKSKNYSEKIIRQ
jgi:hypothetical protein